mmetsp:Transcript_41180/g.101635  ORF Transcript_41180/g.101635 Transcript_41180/m.101635 type:complete len:330 (+) Transcript_41180:539-1528(+)
METVVILILLVVVHLHRLLLLAVLCEHAVVVCAGRRVVLEEGWVELEERAARERHLATLGARGVRVLHGLLLHLGRLALLPLAPHHEHLERQRGAHLELGALLFDLVLERRALVHRQQLIRLHLRLEFVAGRQCVAVLALLFAVGALPDPAVLPPLNRVDEVLADDLGGDTLAVAPLAVENRLLKRRLVLVDVVPLIGEDVELGRLAPDVEVVRELALSALGALAHFVELAEDRLWVSACGCLLLLDHDGLADRVARCLGDLLFLLLLLVLDVALLVLGQLLDVGRRLDVLLHNLGLVLVLEAEGLVRDLLRLGLLLRLAGRGLGRHGG